MLCEKCKNKQAKKKLTGTGLGPSGMNLCYSCVSDYIRTIEEIKRYRMREEKAKPS